EQLKETQEGALKSFSQAKAIQTKKQFSPQLHQDHLVYSTKDQADVQLHHELIYGESLLSYHAKSGRQNLKADSELDIVPVQPNGESFIVMCRGETVADVKVTVDCSQHWVKIDTTDTHGQINMSTPWKGQYELEVSQEIDKTGKLNQQVFKNQYLVTTLSLVH